VIESNCQPVHPQPAANEIRAFFDHTDRYLINNCNIEIRRRVVRDLIANAMNFRILDLGCGDGSISLQFLDPTNSLTLVDISQNMLEVARSRTPSALQASVEYVSEDAARYQSPSKYDLVLCLGLLAHVDAVESTLRNISKLLKGNGRCVLQITDADRISGKLTRAYCNLRNRLSRRYPIAMNHTGMKSVCSIAAGFNMKCVAERRYAGLLPGMGRLPEQWRKRFQLITLETAWLSKYCSEAILLFTKIA
jgi:ubiquinone/menaquinone biosynthesis C-methylase UbiE